jgi:opacity protein-like surface antigen
MKKIAVAVLFLTCASASYGQLFEAWFNGGESILSSRNLGSDIPDTSGGAANDFSLGDGFRFSLRIAFNNDSHFGHEVGYAYSRSSLIQQGVPLEIQGLPPTPAISQGMAIHQGTYNFLVYATPEGTRIRPFATGGVLFANYVPPGSSAAGGGGQTKFGFSYGGGVKIKITSLWGFRVDVRQATTPKPDFGGVLIYDRSGWLKLNEISAGVGVGF